MARTLKDEEERQRRIELVGSYIVETGCSIRETAEIFNKNFFQISIPTVVSYRDLYIKKHPEFSADMEAIIKKNTPETIASDEVKKRILKVAELIKSGFTIEEISKALNVSFWATYRDIERLAKINKELYEEVRKIISDRVQGNLTKK